MNRWLGAARAAHALLAAGAALFAAGLAPLALAALDAATGHGALTGAIYVGVVATSFPVIGATAWFAAHAARAFHTAMRTGRPEDLAAALRAQGALFRAASLAVAVGTAGTMAMNIAGRL